MNSSNFYRSSLSLKTASGLLAMFLFASVAEQSWAQCQNGNRVGNSANNNVANGNNGAGGQNFAGNNFTGNVNAQQTVLQQMLRAQFMSMVLQQAQPQQRPVPPQASNQGRTNRTAIATSRARPPRDPNRPLTREEERVERLREKEKAKRAEYQARIAAKEQELAERRANQ